MSALSAVAAAVDRLVSDLRAAGLTIEDSALTLRRETSALVRLSVELQGRQNDGQGARAPAPTLPAADMETRMADATATAEIVTAPPQFTAKPRAANPVAYIKGPLTDEERAIVQDMLDKGATGKDIGHRLNRDPRQLGGVIRAMRNRVPKRALAPPPAAPVPCPAPTPALGGAPSAPPLDAPVPSSVRALRARLDALDGLDGWNAQRDLALLSSLMRGDGLDAATAASEATSRADARARFDALCPDKTIAKQEQVITELKLRADDGQEGAA